MTLLDIQDRLDALLRESGCRRYTGRQALADAAECWRDVREDDVAHGGSGDAPFFNFVVAEGVGVFALYGAAVDVYVIRGDEEAFRRRFDSLGMTEVERARARETLASDFKRPAPDLTIEPPLSRAWLFADGGDPAEG